MLYYLNRRYSNKRPFPCNPHDLCSHERHKKTDDIILRPDDVYAVKKERIFPFKSINNFERFE